MQHSKITHHTINRMVMCNIKQCKQTVANSVTIRESKSDLCHHAIIINAIFINKSKSLKLV